MGARELCVGVIQYAPSPRRDDALAEAIARVREAAERGADVALLPELFMGAYFCKSQDETRFAAAAPWRAHPAIVELAPLARELDVVLPVSIFEKDGPHYFNSVVMIDSDGTPLGVYRKSHIPDGPGYQEKFYFRPGNTGLRVWETRKGRLGVGICWDQWFPEVARAMTLAGADVLLYPTAIGSEPQDPALDTAARWRRAMVGHAVSNVIPVCAANRIGDEAGQVFYGESFIAGSDGACLAALGRGETGLALARLDLAAIERERAAWGFFRDRRPELYGALTQTP
jgi:N-carbamoylputrescine amidase